MNIRKVVKVFVAKVINMYDNSLDHGKIHIADVIKKSLRYGRVYALSALEMEILMVAAALHDIGLVLGEREGHEVMAYNYVKELVDLKAIFSTNEIETIALCCLHHRTSSNHETLPLLSAIIHDADNSVDIETVIKRCVATRMNQIPKCDEIWLQYVREDVLDYLDKKHGSKGYKKFYLPLQGKMKEELEEGKRLIDNQEDRLFEIIEKYINKLRW